MKGQEAQQEITELRKRLERAEEHIARLRRRRQRSAGLLLLGLIVWPTLLWPADDVDLDLWPGYPIVLSYFLAFCALGATALGFETDDWGGPRRPRRQHEAKGAAGDHDPLKKRSTLADPTLEAPAQPGASSRWCHISCCTEFRL